MTLEARVSHFDRRAPRPHFSIKRSRIRLDSEGVLQNYVETNTIVLETTTTTTNPQAATMKTFTLINLLLTTIYAAASSSFPFALAHEQQSPSLVGRVEKAWQTLDSYWNTLRDLYDDDAILKFCWGSANPDCTEGSVEEILLPFHQALEKFQCEIRVLTGAQNNEVTSLHWNNYQQTPDGCSQVTAGIAVFEFNDENKVIRHYSLSDDEAHCVSNYLASIAVQQE